MTRLITQLCTRVPAGLEEVRTLGRNLIHRRADILAFFDRPHTHRSDQRPSRTPPRLRTRLPQPHPLHHPSAPRDRRLQTSPTPSIVKSQISCTNPILKEKFTPPLFSTFLHQQKNVSNYCGHPFSNPDCPNLRTRAFSLMVRISVSLNPSVFTAWMSMVISRRAPAPARRSMISRVMFPMSRE